MNRLHVLSSNLGSVSYDQATAVLEIRFLSIAAYQYSGVSTPVYQGPRAVHSKSRYFHTKVERLYPYQRII